MQQFLEVTRSSSTSYGYNFVQSLTIKLCYSCKCDFVIENFQTKEQRNVGQKS